MAVLTVTIDFVVVLLKWDTEERKPPRKSLIVRLAI